MVAYTTHGSVIRECVIRLSFITVESYVFTWLASHAQKAFIAVNTLFLYTGILLSKLLLKRKDIKEANSRMMVGKYYFVITYNIT